MADPNDQVAAEIRLQRLLAEANRLRAGGDLEAAEQRCRQALALAPGNADAHELLGDVFHQQRRGQEAIEQFRLARAANPRRRLLEDKIARASLIIAEADIVRLQAQELLAGRRNQMPRRPGVSALLSLVIPGFGQIYNGEHLKGAAMVCAWLLLMLGAVAAVIGSLGGGVSASPGAFDLFALVALFFSAPAVWYSLVIIALVLFAVVDAALVAAKTMTAPEDLA